MHAINLTDAADRKLCEPCWRTVADFHVHTMEQLVGLNNGVPLPARQMTQ